jgi:hypothetical protein
MRPIERLGWYLKHNKIMFSTVERAIGLGNGYLSRQIKNQGSIGSDILEKICLSYPKLNTTWLLTGKGEPETTAAKTESGFADSEQVELYSKQIENLSEQVELLKQEIKLLKGIIEIQRKKLNENPPEN